MSEEGCFQVMNVIDWYWREINKMVDWIEISLFLFISSLFIIKNTKDLKHYTNQKMFFVIM